MHLMQVKAEKVKDKSKESLRKNIRRLSLNEAELLKLRHINGRRGWREIAYLLDFLDFLEITDFGLFDIRIEPDQQNTHGAAGEEQPAQEAQIQDEQTPFEAAGLDLAHLDGLHDADTGVFAEVVDREAVAVDGDKTGDDEQHRPQSDKNAHDQVQQDQLAGKGETVEQRGVGHFPVLTDPQGVQDVAAFQHGQQQRDHHGDEGDQQRRVGGVAEQQRNRPIGEILLHIIGGAAGNISVQASQCPGNKEVEQGKEIDGHNSAAVDLAGLAF